MPRDMEEIEPMHSVFHVAYPDTTTYEFAPNAPLDDKHNYSKHNFIRCDGTIKEVIRLNVLDDRHREEIVAFHFCRQYAERHYRGSNKQPRFQVVARDDPWDFDYLLHDGTRFSLEICRVADTALLKAIKAENDVLLLLQRDQLRTFEILKITRLFPDLLDNRLVAQATDEKDKQRLFKIEKGDWKPIFIRPTMTPELNLGEAIETAITKKVKKNHSGKESTILVLDNLTTHNDPRDFFDTIEALGTFIDEVPFPSIWVYTGYYSDDEGGSCEYDLLPLKLGERENQELADRVSKQRIKQ